MENGVTGVATTAASWVRTPRPPALHGQSGGRPSALLRMRTMSRTLINASTEQFWSSMLAAHLWKVTGGGLLTGRLREKLMARTTSRMFTALSAFTSALATPLNGALLPEMLMAASVACSFRGVRVIGSSGSRQQPMLNVPLPTPEKNGRLAGCTGPAQTGPPAIPGGARWAVAGALLEG